MLLLTRKKFTLTCAALFCSAPLLFSQPEVEKKEVPSGMHTIHFVDVPIVEFIRYVSKISEVNFIFDQQDLQFNISFSTGKAVASQDVLRALVQMLRTRGFAVAEEDHYFVIHHFEEGKEPLQETRGEGLIASTQNWLHKSSDTPAKFSVYKLQYHQGSEIEEAIKKIAADMKSQPHAQPKLLNAIQTMHWVKSTNSLLFSGDEETTHSLKELILSLDIPLKQVFIEVLVVETSMKKMLDFGLQWGAGGKYLDKVGFGMNNFAPHASPGVAAFGNNLQGTNALNPPTGYGQIPILNGFDFGVIGDLIMHKGQSYLTLGSLVSALQIDGDSTIVLNQKIITQDNKNSKIFVGENIPFTGSVVQTVGQSQQTTANIEYRDVGVSLSITPMLGEGEIITMDLNEEITEARNDPRIDTDNVTGIRTTKTNMVTHVHVPDKHFLVLSGMIRNHKAYDKAGLPCLGGLPVIGAAFSRNGKRDDRRNVIIFVRPHIIHSFDDYERVTESQEMLYEKQSAPGQFEEALQIMNP